MRLLGRGGAARLHVDGAPRRPTDEVVVGVTLDKGIDRVSAARVELGYLNTYAYRWAGRRDAAARGDSLLMLDQVGTQYGGVRTTEDWVPALGEDLPVAGGVLEPGTREVRLRLPSWAPASGKDLVAWQARLEVAREGRGDVSAAADLSVLAPEPAEPGELRTERVAGDSCDIEVTTDRPCWRAGEAVTGTVTLTPRGAVPAADVAVLVQRVRLSHPLERTPGDGEEFYAKPVTLDKRLELTPGTPSALPFSAPLAADAPPTAEAVNSSFVWWVVARVFYAGFSAHSPERVRREIVVYNA